MATLELTEEPDASELAEVGKALADFNAADVGPSGRRTLAILIRNDDGTVAGGLSGYTAWGWLYIQWLFVPEALRGQGLAGKMLQQAETEATARGCHGAWIDTFNPLALRAYKKQGFTVFGELPDFPAGRIRAFLHKRFD